MYFQLMPDSFVRKYSDIGLILNQCSRDDRVYDEVGAEFLLALGRKPKHIEEITDRLVSRFSGVRREILKDDFISFAQELTTEGFVGTGRTIEETTANCPGFSYRYSPTPGVMREQGLSIRSSRELLEEHFIQKPQLFSLQIELTAQCNERCVHCYQHCRTADGHLPEDLVIQVLDEAAAMGTMQITFTGGDPLLHPHLMDLLHHAHALDLSISLLTNGMRMTWELASALRDINVSVVQLSLYSMAPEVHDSITQVNGSWERTYAAIEKLISFDVRVQIGCPVMKQNFGTFADVITWGNSKRIRVNPDLYLMASSDFNAKNLMHRLSVFQARSAIEQIIERDEAYRSTLQRDGTPRSPDPSSPPCGIGTYMMCLSSSGEFNPCPGFGMNLGNVFTRRLQDAWENSPGLKKLRSIKLREYEKCLTCSSWWYCSLCPAKFYNESAGNMLAIPEHFCELSHLNRDLVQRFLDGNRAGEKIDA